MSPPPTDSPIARLLDRLRGVKATGKTTWEAHCPSHEDSTPSLSLSQGRDGRVLVHCHAGCQPADIVGAVGLAVSDLFVERPKREPAPILAHSRPSMVKSYDYTDEDGTLLYQVCRFEPKTFRQRRPTASGEWDWKLGDVRRVLYRLPAILERGEQQPVYVVEGEKDADTLAEAGYCATTSTGGAQGWKEEFADALRGASVIVIPDNDEPGREYAEAVAASCYARSAAVRVVTLPDVAPKGDVSDWLAAGHTLDELQALVDRAPFWTPNPTTRVRWRLDEVLRDEAIMHVPPPVVPRLAWPRHSTLLAAAEKSGKSTLTGYMAACVSAASPFFGEPCNHGEPGDVLVFGLEEFLGNAARRLRDFGADATRVHLVPHLTAEPLDRLRAVRSHIEAVRPALVILDTLMAYSAGAVTDASSSAQMQAVVQGLTDVAHDAGPAMIIVHHARKSDGKYRDSSAIGGAVDAIVEIFTPEEESDPTLRRARARGRIPVSGFDFRLTPHGYQLANGQTQPLDARILDILRNRPSGTTVRTLVDLTSARGADVLNTLERMLADRRVLDLNNGASQAKKLVASEAVGGTLFPTNSAAQTTHVGGSLDAAA